MGRREACQNRECSRNDGKQGDGGIELQPGVVRKETGKINLRRSNTRRQVGGNEF